MSAETLRRAAALMRERAEPLAAYDVPATLTISLSPERVDQRLTEFSASWHPAVALAVADWLDATSAKFEFVLAEQYDPPPREFRPALAVARAYLGETP